MTQLELRQPNPGLRAAITGPLREYLQLIEEVIKEGIERQEVAFVNIRGARQMIFGALDEATTDWVMARNPQKITDDVDAMLYLFAGALRLPEEG